MSKLSDVLNICTGVYHVQMYNHEVHKTTIKPSVLRATVIEMTKNHVFH